MMVSAFRQLGISIALGSCLALGCGGEKSETSAPGSAGSTAESPSPAPGSPTPESPAVAEEVVLTELPDTFPEDVPRYPGADVVTAGQSADAGWVVNFSSPDEPAKVASYFADALAAQGWATQRVDAPDAIMVLAEKGVRSATYAISPDAGETKIALIVAEKG